ncbi:MAG: helix-hairpin-helix domain-containing protein [Vicinamibacterales bacterium]
MGITLESMAHRAVVCLIAIGGAVVARGVGNANAGSQAHNMTPQERSLQTVCGACHDLDLVRDAPRSYESWLGTVRTMVNLGATGTDEQFDDVTDYLHRTVSTIDVNKADVDELQIVLGVSGNIARAVAARRTAKPFKDLADLKSVQGVDAAALDQRASVIFFQ